MTDQPSEKKATITLEPRYSVTDFSPAARAARDVPQNPHPLCREFRPKLEPAEFWCVTCGWNEPMHDDETTRVAIAVELARVADGEVTS